MAGVDILASAFSGANAAFLADLYARWAADPASVDPSFGELFGALNDEARSVLEDATGASWAPRQSAFGECAPAAPQHRGVRSRAAVQRAGPRRHHRLAARADADPLLSRARPSGGAARPARPADPRAACRARSADLWLHRRRSRPADLHRQRAGPRNRDAARDHDDPARDLLRPDRRRVHAHPGSRAEVLDPAQGRRRALATRVRRRGQAHDPASSSPRPRASRRSARSAMSPPSASAWRAARSPSRRCTR